MSVDHSRPLWIRRLLLIVPFALMIAGVVAAIHVYLAVRLILEPALDEPLRGAMLLLLGAGAASLLLEPFGERLLRPPWSRLLAWPASLWMGLMFLAVLALLASDLFLWLWGYGAGDGSTAPGDPALARTRAVAVLGLTGIVAAVALRGGLRPPQLRRVEIRLPRWPRALDRFRIVQISDLHIGPILGRRFAQRLVERVNALRADLVAVTGDLADGDARKLAGEVAPLAGLRAEHGTFFVTGNHDHYSGAESWVAMAAELGMRPLRNERVTITHGAGCFELAGVDDHRADLVDGGIGEDLPRALADRDADAPLVLLAHDPTTFIEASRMGVSLQLSGHTHGGQIWPFRYLVRLAIPFVAGHYRRNGCQLYVSRGTGFWGPPMRLFAPAEITEIVLRAAD